ncbi:MAG: hypothetical protein JXX29_18705 [Deltaproteobacteria bacterium]|nr:hypothetical protein [Deltaproteobacteria bacterium]MBN2673717.1 hypothetical protein [Deltaproteobacteria bacterium]
MLDKIEYREDGVLVVFSGVVTSEELVSANTEVLRHLAQSPYRYQIFAFLDVENFIVSAEEMRYVAMQDIAAFKEHPIQKVATVSKSQLVYGIARMYDAFSCHSTAETQIFEELEDAERWVNS